MAKRRPEHVDHIARLNTRIDYTDCALIVENQRRHKRAQKRIEENRRLRMKYGFRPRKVLLSYCEPLQVRWECGNCGHPLGTGDMDDGPIGYDRCPECHKYVAVPDEEWDAEEWPVDEIVEEEE